MSVHRLGLLLSAALLVSAACALPALGAGRSLADAPPIPGQTASLSPEFHASLVTNELRPTGVKRINRGEWWGGPIVTSTGETVTIYVSDLFVPDESLRLAWANWFSWLYHGPELASLAIYQVPVDEANYICGNADAYGCYSPSRRILVFPGDLDPSMDADVGAHEYGHHIAANRRNDPWDPNAWGPKRWASYVGVCARAAAGTVFPGDEGDHYTLNTGEAFAEAYRVLNEQRGGMWANLSLVVDSSLAPDAGSLTAVLADVQQPWLGPALSSWDGAFAAPVVTLRAAVGPGARISLQTAGGARVSTLTLGVYAFAVRDVSAKDDFHLTGPSVNRRTGVPGKGSVVWKLQLNPGTYRYRSDAHPNLGGSFTVRPSEPAAFAPQERTIPTLLDGSFQASISGTANASLELLDPATGQDLVPATPGAISFTICGQRSVLLRVAAAQAGSFHVNIATP
jgi:hypothetical protein